ncbi:MAG TPA: ankyrin repeat domain-containing protein, partial [bacterium]|nr:ankyrin repeat domain-containing protein [bacterium]
MPSTELVRDFVIAGHGDLKKVKAMLAQHPDLLNATYEWKPGDHETAIQAAAHVGNAAVAEHLLSRGAPLEICT